MKAITPATAKKQKTASRRNPLEDLANAPKSVIEEQKRLQENESSLEDHPDPGEEDRKHSPAYTNNYLDTINLTNDNYPLD